MEHHSSGLPDRSADHFSLLFKFAVVVCLSDAAEVIVLLYCSWLTNWSQGCYRPLDSSVK